MSSNIEAEEKLAEWLGVESTLIYPSVTLANQGAIPALAGRKDVVVIDELAHNSMQEGARLAQAGGAGSRPSLITALWPWRQRFRN